MIYLEINSIGIALLLSKNPIKVFVPVTSKENHMYFKKRLNTLKTKKAKRHNIIAPIHEDQLGAGTIKRTLIALSN